ncbi:hypothetical protein DV701_07935 [Ornithinimicrobium avium]|uniref:Uncharacterized protein n=1 Tax=Ornithinimicrobium avium TaxID=2283195 RepID=A0A345NM11_9MICO|nr:hypothetical protein DV701_07935 [Ornithinimicrobium avium]
MVGTSRGRARAREERDRWGTRTGTGPHRRRTGTPVRSRRTGRSRRRRRGSRRCVDQWRNSGRTFGLYADPNPPWQDLSRSVADRWAQRYGSAAQADAA